jgi:hypothetical protein
MIRVGPRPSVVATSRSGSAASNTSLFSALESEGREGPKRPDPLFRVFLTTPLMSVFRDVSSR